jgi:hypothetical protein
VSDRTLSLRGVRAALGRLAQCSTHGRDSATFIAPCLALCNPVNSVEENGVFAAPVSVESCRCGHRAGSFVLSDRDRCQATRELSVGSPPATLVKSLSFPRSPRWSGLPKHAVRLYHNLSRSGISYRTSTRHQPGGFQTCVQAGPKEGPAIPLSSQAWLVPRRSPPNEGSVPDRVAAATARPPCTCSPGGRLHIRCPAEGNARPWFWC